MRKPPVFPMTPEEETRAMIAIFHEERNKPRSRERALELFIGAGIFDEDGNPTEPYKELYEWIDKEPKIRHEN